MNGVPHGTLDMGMGSMNGGHAGWERIGFEIVNSGAGKLLYPDATIALVHSLFEQICREFYTLRELRSARLLGCLCFEQRYSHGWIA